MAFDSKDKSAEKKGVRKPSFFKRITDSVRGIRREMKRVVWPNRKTMRESVAAVLVISLAVTLVLFITDTVMIKILDASGFNRVEVSQQEAMPDSGVSDEASAVEESAQNEAERDAEKQDAEPENDAAASDETDSAQNSSDEKNVE